MSESKLCNERVKAMEWHSQSYAFILSNSINCFKTKMKTRSATKPSSRCTLCFNPLAKKGNLLFLEEQIAVVNNL